MNIIAGLRRKSNSFFSKFPPITEKNMNAGVEALGEYIYQWFHIEQKFSIDDLEQLFGVSLPEEIFFLRANAETLFERIKEREVKEAHERPEVLQQLDAVYFALCQSLKTHPNTKITITNAADFAELDNLTEYFLSLIHES